MTSLKSPPCEMPELYYRGKVYQSYQEIEDVGFELYLEKMSKAGKPRPRNSELGDKLLVASSSWCDRVASHIRCAYENLAPKAALILISAIWEKLDRTAKLAESRGRLLVGRLESPPMADAPHWLSVQLADFNVAGDSLGPANPLAIAATERLIRSVIHDFAESPEATVCKAPQGHVFVNWEVSPNVLQWEVVPSGLPWPGVLVNSVYCNRREGSGIKARIFHNAFDVIDSFRESLHDHAGFK